MSVSQTSGSSAIGVIPLGRTVDPMGNACVSPGGGTWTGRDAGRYHEQMEEMSARARAIREQTARKQKASSGGNGGGMAHRPREGVRLTGQ